ncbi:DUF948 domain-containing protein [Bacillus seohaeanensis]|uniref:DUF948 domain-containing protein n=1 Tax=Bacillus seohaeanensis TaxID=284580 RepID=A0ABW5RXB0_9BACI
MWIVYASIGLFVAAFVYLGIELVKILKKTRPVVDGLNTIVEKIQSHVDQITTETNQLQKTQTAIQEDIQFKKGIIIETIENAKEVIENVKSLLNVVKG